MVSDEFVYNDKEKGAEGLQLVCRHMADLRDAFPKMNMAANYFRDDENDISLFVLVVMGEMKAPWLNRPASNKHEHVGIVFHVRTTESKLRVKELHFRSEFLTEQCYQKLRTLDLIHTAFTLDVAKKNMENVEKGNKADEVEAVRPLMLLANVSNKQVNAAPKVNEIQRERNRLFLAELEKAREAAREEERAKLTSAELGVPGVVEKEEIVIPGNQNMVNVDNTNNLNDENNEEEDTDDENNEESEEEEVNLNQDPEEVIQRLKAQGLNSNTINRELEFINTEKAERNLQAGGDGYYAAVEQMPVGGQPVYQGYSSCCPPYFGTGKYDPMCQSGGDGYAKVEQIPVGGQPIYQGYSSCCPPAFTTDGSEFDPLCQSGGTHRPLKVGSLTLALVKDGVVRAITTTVMEEMTNETSNMMGIRDAMLRKRIHGHMRHQMGPHVHKVVRHSVDNAAKNMKGVLPLPTEHTKLIMLPKKTKKVKKNAKKSTKRKSAKKKVSRKKKGGAVVGSLGTILLPEGATAAGITPFLLALGAKIVQRIEHGVYTLPNERRKRIVRRRRKKPANAEPKKKKRRRKRSGTKKGMVRKTARRAYTGLKKKKRRRKRSRKRSTSKSRKPKKKTKKRKFKTRSVPQRKRRGWKPISNADIRRMMRRQRGGGCGAGICGDAALNPFDGCKRPEWGPRNWTSCQPMCI
jgi:hypothetical protein